MQHQLEAGSLVLDVARGARRVPADDVCLLGVAMRTGSLPPGGPVPFE